MANKNIKEVEGGAVATLNDSDALEIDTGTVSYYILWQDVKLLMATALRGMNDYKIVPSVSSNNLSLDIQHFDGTAVSSAYPLKFRVGGSAYTLTSSPSFTKNAGTNWANAGAAETAAQDIDWFVYAIGETGASAGLKFGYSRIPYAQTMNDFSSTSTNEKYIAGNYTNFNTSDAVVNIGRFRATLGASASYNWSIPNTLVINYPIFETDFLTYAPTLTGFSANPTNTIYQYKLQWKEVILRARQGANGTSNATGFTLTAPLTAQTVTNGVWQSTCQPVVDNGALTTTPGLFQLSTGSATINVYKDTSAAAWTAANGKRFAYTELRYPLAA